jgi:hypothetical protein
MVKENFHYQKLMEPYPEFLMVHCLVIQLNLATKHFSASQMKKLVNLIFMVKSQGVTVMAWVKWEGNTGFVGGMWNEYQDGGKRQYGLFVSLPHYNGEDQVCGHISYSGKPTPPFPYSIDYSASKQIVKRTNGNL